ncbi:MAG: TPM domain-containing protein [Daejeonella sp.]
MLFKPQLLLVFFILFVSCKQQPVPDYYTLETVPDPKTLNESFVSDPDTLLSKTVVDELNSQLKALDDSGRVHIDVVLLNSIGDELPKYFATSLFDMWKIGDPEKDNGLLILIIKDQQRIEFETGYGLEGDLPDAICFRIQQEHMVPYLRENNFDTAVTEGVQAVIKRLNNPEPVQNNTVDSTAAAPDTTVYYSENPSTLNDQVLIDESFFNQRLSEALPLLFGAFILYSGFIILPFSVYKERKEKSESKKVKRLSLSDKKSKKISEYTSTSIKGDLLQQQLSDETVIKTSSITAESPSIIIKPSLLSRKLSDESVIKTSFILILPPVLAAAYLVVFTTITFNIWIIVALLYATWLLYLTYYVLKINWRASVLSKNISRYDLYIQLNRAHAYMIVAYILFPLPLVLYYFWHRIRMRKLRKEPYACEKCNHTMRLLNEKEDDEHLLKSRIVEEGLLSIDYDVWLCENCKHEYTLTYDNVYSDIECCPGCKNKTLKQTKKQDMVKATTYSSGWGLRHFVCGFCGQKPSVMYIIPELSSSSSSNSSSSSFGSSSGSSSSGSSSGGSSGGGGAGSSW